MFTDTVQRQTV